MLLPPAIPEGWGFCTIDTTIPVFKISTELLTFFKKSGKVQIQNDIFKSQRNRRNRGQKCCHCAVSIRGYSQTTYYRTRYLLRKVVLEMSSVCKFYLISLKKFLHKCQQGAGTTGCLNAKLDVLNTYLAIKSPEWLQNFIWNSIILFRNIFVQKHQNKVILAISLLISWT